MLLGAIILAILHSGECLSAQAKDSLKKALPGVDLEERRARLKRLGTLYLKKYNITSQKQPTSQNGQTDIGWRNRRRSDGGSRERTGVPKPKLSNITEPSLEEINQDEGVADYLFNGDINLTEYQMQLHSRKQLEMIERSLTESNMTRHKRQMDSVNPRWPNNQLFYEFHSSTSMRALRSSTLNLNGTVHSDSFGRVANGQILSAPPYHDNKSLLEAPVSALAISMDDGAQLYLKVGIAAHEFMHALGSWHMHMRGDRDDFLIVDLTNVPASKQGNFAKLGPDSTINYTPYEYGSVMHYAANLFTTKGYSLKPRLGRYLQTEGTRVISFFDMMMLKSEKKKAITMDATPAGCGETLVATAAWKTKTFTFGNAAVKTQRDNYMRCNHWIRYGQRVPLERSTSACFLAPVADKDSVRVTAFKNVQCGVGCRVNSIELKTLPNKRMTNPR
ncbi:astacin [Cooperia oncophora]